MKFPWLNQSLNGSANAAILGIVRMPIPVFQEKQAVLTKSHGKTQGNSFMDEKIEAKTNMEARAPAWGFSGVSADPRIDVVTQARNDAFF
ncbi:MAG: hypothetical protein WBA34_04355 [Candidatus Deferrimicrobiaceae bacterium]